MRRGSYILLVLGMLLATGACMKDDELWERKALEEPTSGHGLFIVNEGNFTYENASLSYYDIEKEEIHNDVFFNTNSLPLGDVAYSMTIRDSLAYIVVNNSGRIYIISTSTFEYRGKITGLVSPRNIHFLSDTKAYVTDLYGRAITIVNPRSMEITGHIDVSHPDGKYFQHSTEQLLQYERFVYVNCWSFDNQVLILDSETDQVLDSVRVIKQPNSMALDRHNNLWILSDGGFPESPYGYELPGLLRLAPGEREAELVYRFARGEMPRNLQVNGTGDTLYFLNRHVYRFVPALHDEPEVFAESPYDGTYGGGYYGLHVDPQSSEVYVSDAIDYVQQGIVYRFAPDGAAADTFRAGISPGAFCFKP